MGRKILLHGEANLDLEDNARLAEVARAWFTQAAARLFPRLQQLADQGAPEVDSGITVARTMDDMAKSTRIPRSGGRRCLMSLTSGRR